MYSSQFNIKVTEVHSKKETLMATINIYTHGVEVGTCKQAREPFW